MNLDQAKELISRIAYRPGYSFAVLASSTPTRLWLRISATLPDSDPCYAPSFTKLTEVADDVPIQLSSISNAQGLYRAVLDHLIVRETHEAREFFREDQGGFAPFHPHHRGARSLWESTG